MDSGKTYDELEKIKTNARRLMMFDDLSERKKQDEKNEWKEYVAHRCKVKRKRK